MCVVSLQWNSAVFSHHNYRRHIWSYFLLVLCLGNYLLVDAVTSANKRAIFQSPEYKRTGVPGSCNLSFAYHVTGAGVGNLSVIVQEQARGNERVIWAARGPQGQQWMKAVVSFDSSVNYKVRIISIWSQQSYCIGCQSQEFFLS